jgi:hypothetical protein
MRKRRRRSITPCFHGFRSCACAIALAASHQQRGESTASRNLLVEAEMIGGFAGKINARTR